MMILHVILDFGNKKKLMGQLNKYKCKNCDFEIVAAPEGVSVLMDGAYAHFLCPTCKKVVDLDFQSNSNQPKCPKCGNKDIYKWAPEDFCPQCGSELENLGLYCMED
jgi:predicted RNA-binding Zn-ribbon protein involved in translation (DUF1610 family)